MTQPGSAPGLFMPAQCLSMQTQPTLLGGGLTLRPWCRSDAPELVEAYADPAIYQWHCRSLSLADAESWVVHELERWGQDLGSSWAITRNDSLCGRVGIGGVRLDEGRAGVTYWVLPAARGQGVAPQALGAVVDWAFGTAGFHRLELNHSTLNEASCRVATKAGFAAEGTKRAEGLHLDGWHDMHAHAVLADDPRPQRPLERAAELLPVATDVLPLASAHAHYHRAAWVTSSSRDDAPGCRSPRAEGTC